MTSRGFLENDFKKVAHFIDEAVQITLSLSQSMNKVKFKEFNAGLGDGSKFPKIQDLKKKVEDYVTSFPKLYQ